LDLLTGCDPLLEFSVLNISRAIFIDDLELLIRELLDSEPAGLLEPDYFAKTKDATHKELAQLLSVE